MNITRRLLLKLAAWFSWRSWSAVLAAGADGEPAQPFGAEFPNLDSLAVGEWWKKKPAPKGPSAPPPMDVPRDQVVAFALYTHDRGVLKITAQLYPLKPGEPREARLAALRRRERWRRGAIPGLVHHGGDGRQRRTQAGRVAAGTRLCGGGEPGRASDRRTDRRHPIHGPSVGRPLSAGGVRARHVHRASGSRRVPDGSSTSGLEATSKIAAGRRTITI